MTWFFLLVVFGTGGVAYEYRPATSETQCEGMEPMARAAWYTEQRIIPGLGQIMGMQAFCTEIPIGIDRKRFVTRAPRIAPVTTYRPTVGPFLPPLQ